MDYSLKLATFSAGVSLWFAQGLLLSCFDSATEFFERNPECSPEDLASFTNIIRSSFKKTESFKLVLLAAAASFFIYRLCWELGRIIMDAQNGVVAKEADRAKTQEAVISQLQSPPKQDDTVKERTRLRKLLEATELIATILDSFAFYYYMQRRALMGEETAAFDTKFCQHFTSDSVSACSLVVFTNFGLAGNLPFAMAVPETRGLHPRRVPQPASGALSPA